jgi:hypothetical protein
MPPFWRSSSWAPEILPQYPYVLFVGENSSQSP